MRWATTCERIEVDDRGAHSLLGVGVSILLLEPPNTDAHIPVFASLSVPRHELDQDLKVQVVVTDPADRPVAESSHTVRIPAASLPSGAMDGYEVPAYLSVVIGFEVGREGPYSLFVSPPPRPGDLPPEPLIVFVART